ncbi:MAG: alpha/beta fold hydrolase [Christensenellaceae bacterium]|jgi:pimeloyl-ACP methyl ester carboxylesterase
MAYITFQDKKLYYERMGDGPPLLLLHGNTASSNMFYEIAPAFKDAYEVILIDFLGHGRSDRLAAFPADLWFYEAEQVIALIEALALGSVNLIGSSGGALVAINVALEAPALVRKVIADSFEGKSAMTAFTENIAADRALSKNSAQDRQFYEYMHGADWESVVDLDTAAIAAHGSSIGNFFHKPLSALQAPILFTGSKEDEFTALFSPDYFAETYGEMIGEIGHGEMYLFPTGGHPALLSNATAFTEISKTFLAE